MLAIKLRILRIWDTAVTGVRICCIKFAQRVVLVQTAAPATNPPADPKVRLVCEVSTIQTNFVQRGDPMEVSLAIVPPNSTLLPVRNLEAEASGLLDRMLGVFQESVRYVLRSEYFAWCLADSYSDAILVDATLNSLSILIRARPNTANKILNVILNFNPLKQANSPMTPKLRVTVKSMEKTTRLLLTHIYKR